MERKVIAEGKTTNEAIENGLKELNVSRNKVDVKVLENEEKRSFFSILAPRVVKVELTVKDEKENSKTEIKPKKIVELTIEEQQKAEQNMQNFLKDFVKTLPEGTEYEIQKTVTGLNVNISSKNLGYLIGYRRI